MRIPKLLAGLTVAGVLGLGTVGIAAAQDSGSDGIGSAPSTTVAPAPEPTDPAVIGRRCERAEKLLARLQKIDARIPARLTALQDKLTQAQQAGDTAKADRIQKRIDRLNELKPRLEERISTLQQKIAEKCSNVTPSTQPHSA